MIVIGLTGRRGAGKDTAYGFLRDAFGAVRFAFADGIRQEVAERFGVPVAWLADPALKDRPVPYRMRRSMKLPLKLRMIGCLTPRHMLQWWGDARRAEDPDYWTGSLLRAIEAARPAVAVVTDIRLPREAELLRRRFPGMTRIIRIERPSLYRCVSDTDLHDTEQAVDDIPVDRVVTNWGGDLNRFRQEFMRAVGSMGAAGEPDAPEALTGPVPAWRSSS